MERDIERLQRRIDKLDKDYSSTLSEILTDVHYLKCKFNKDNQLEYEQKQNDLECKKAEDLNQISDKKFAFRFGYIAFVSIGVIAVLFTLIKYLFF